MVTAALRNPGTDNLVGQKLRERRQRAGVPITGLAATLAVPYQQLRRLEIGTSTDPTSTSSTARHSPSTNSEQFDTNRSIHP